MSKVTENQDSGTCIILRERKSLCKKTKQTFVDIL